MSDMHVDHLLKDVAIIGMFGRFPGAWNLDQFWANLRGGVESVVSSRMRNWRRRACRLPFSTIPGM